MSNITSAWDSIPTDAIPARLIKEIFNQEVDDVEELLGSGASLTIRQDSDTSRLMFEEIVGVDAVADLSNIGLLTEHGEVQLHNYEAFFQALTGVPFSVDDPHKKELLTIAASMLPKELVALLGWVSPLDKPFKKQTETTVLSVKLISTDTTVACFMSAPSGLWLEALTHTSLKRNKAIPKEPTAIAIATPIVVGTTAITPSMFYSLKAGDVVMLDTPLFNTEGEGEIEVFFKRFQAKIESTNESGSLDNKMELTLLDEMKTD